MWLRLFSDIKTWPKAQTFFFTKDKEGGESADNSIEVRFNDGSLCDVSGTMRIILPSSEPQAIELVSKYGYMDYKDLEQKLVLPVVRNALRLTANLHVGPGSPIPSSARTSFFGPGIRSRTGSTKRTEETRKVVDPVSGQEATKTFKIIKKVEGGSPVYQRNPLEGLGITLANFEVKLFDYTDKVRAQIGTQQTALMAVATARSQGATGGTRGADGRGGRQGERGAGQVRSPHFQFDSDLSTFRRP